ncbi:MAG: NAD(P)H-binding protein [Pseudomonadota bacterium]
MTAPILVMGATAGIGACAVQEIVGRGLTVRAFARGASKLMADDLLTPVPGNARDLEAVTNAVLGVRAVIYALGIKERLAMLWEEETLFSDSTKVLVDAMHAAQVCRLVAVTGFGAGRSRTAMSTLEKIGHRLVLGKPYADKDRQEGLILESDLDWTIARPVILTKGAKSGRMQVLRETNEWRNGLVSRADVASYLVDAVENDLDVQKDVVLAR